MGTLSVARSHGSAAPKDPEQPRHGRAGWSARAGPGAADHALVAHESPAAAGEACAVLLAPAGGRASDPVAVRRHAAEDLGAAGAGKLTRGTCNAARLAKKEHKYGAVSEECPESGGSSRSHVSVG